MLHKRTAFPEWPEWDGAGAEIVGGGLETDEPLITGGSMASNRGVAYMGPRKVEVRSIDFPTRYLPSVETTPITG